MTSQSQRKSHQNTNDAAIDEETLEDLEEMTSNCVRYVIMKAGSGLPIKKSDLYEITTKSTLTFNTVLERAKIALLDVYGYDLWELSGKVKCYSVANVLEHVDIECEEENSDEENEDADRVLLLLVLLHIFMSNGCVSDRSLMDFLESFKIKLEEKHPIFGSIKDFLQNLVKTKYLLVEAEQGTQRLNYKWGEKAEKEVSKMEILNFFAKVCEVKKIQSFYLQYTEAREQFRKEDEKMDVSE